MTTLTVSAPVSTLSMTFSSKEFTKELDYLVKVMANKPTLPILNNILVQSVGDRTGVRLTATCLEMGMIVFCPAQVHSEGNITIPARHLLDVLRLLPDREVTVVVEQNGWLELKAGKYTTRIPSQPADYFPTVPTLTGLTQVTLPPTFLDMVKNVRFAAASDDKKYSMTGALMNGSKLVTTDGTRLAVAGAAAPVELDDVFVPSQALDVLLDLAPTETIFALGERHMFFIADARMMYSGRPEAKFPAYERIIPKDHTHSASILRGALLDAMKRMVVTSKEGSVSLTFTEGEVTLHGKSQEMGDATEVLDANYEGRGATVTLRGSLVIEYLARAKGMQINMAWKGAGAVLFSDDVLYSYVQMPVRV
jgi:DNA polymerase III subunit beta